MDIIITTSDTGLTVNDRLRRKSQAIADHMGKESEKQGLIIKYKNAEYMTDSQRQLKLGAFRLGTLESKKYRRLSI